MNAITAQSTLLSALRDTCVLVSFKRSSITGIRRAREFDPVLASTANSRAGAIRANKNILAGGEHHLKAVTAAFNKFEAYLKRVSLPYGRFGQRLLPNASLLDFAAQAHAARAEVSTLVESMIADYDAIKLTAAANLGSGYDPSLYPSPETLRRVITLETDINPLPDASGYSDTLPPAVIEKMASFMERKADEKTRHALTALARDIAATATSIASSASRAAAADGSHQKGRVREETVQRLSAQADMAKTFSAVLDHDDDMRLAFEAQLTAMRWIASRDLSVIREEDPSIPTTDRALMALRGREIAEAMRALVGEHGEDADDGDDA